MFQFFFVWILRICAFFVLCFAHPIYNLRHFSVSLSLRSRISDPESLSRFSLFPPPPLPPFYGRTTTAMHENRVHASAPHCDTRLQFNRDKGTALLPSSTRVACLQPNEQSHDLGMQRSMWYGTCRADEMCCRAVFQGVHSASKLDFKCIQHLSGMEAWRLSSFLR